MEMYKNESAKNIYYKLFYKDPYNWCEIIFGKLINAGVIIKNDINTLYYRFYGPIFTLILECDLKSYSEDELLNKVINHGKLFLEEFKVK